MSVALTLLVAVVGLLVYILSANGKLAEVGRLMFFCGLFIFLLRTGPEIVRLFGG